MKHFLRFLFIGIGLFQTIHADGIDISVDKTATPYKYGGKNGNAFEYVFAETTGEYLVLRASYSLFSFDYKLARYDKSTLNLLEVKPLFPKDYIKKGNFKPTYSWGINQYNDHIYFLFGYRDQSKNNTSIYYQKLNEDGSFEGTADKLLEAPFDNGRPGDFGGMYSYDSTKFLSVYTIPTKGKENQEYNFHVYNITDMSVVFERNVVLPYMDKDVELIRYDVDNDGNVYGLVKIRDKGDKDFFQTNYIYKIYAFNKANDRVVEYDFDAALTDDIYLNSITFTVKNGLLYCSGFWGKKNTDNISGVYSMRVNISDESVEGKDFYEFSDDFIAEFYTEKQVEKAEKKDKELEIKEISLDYFVLENDGSAYLIGEQFYTYQRCYFTSNGSMRCVTYYVHNDIIATKINPEGEILWAAKIPKKSQAAYGSSYLSYHFFKKGKNLYFIYYDNQENFALVDPKKYDRVPPFGKKLDLVCTKIDDNGEKEKTLIYNYGDAAWNQLRMAPLNMQNISMDHFITNGIIKGNKEILVRFNVR